MTLNDFLAKAGNLLGMAEKAAPDLAAFQSKVSGLETELTAARASIADLEAKLQSRTSEVATLTASLEAEKEKSKAFDVKVESAASQKALEITAAQGQAPVISIPQSKPGQEQKKEVKGFERFQSACKVEQTK